jgi:hypothetical protein
MYMFKNDLFIRRIAIILVVSMALISIVPRAEAAFISSDESFSYNKRQQDTATIKKTLEQKLVKHKLINLGYSEDEVKARLDKLSENELHKVATQLDSIKAGGGLGGVLVLSAAIVGLIMLILYIVAD